MNPHFNYQKHVTKNNDTSSIVGMPAIFIGQKIIVEIPKKEIQKKQNTTRNSIIKSIIDHNSEFKII